MKMRVLIILCIATLSISSCQIFTNNNLSINDIEKYSDDVNVKYYLRSNYGYNSYILNIINDSVVEATKSVANYNDKYAEFNGYHATRIKGITAIYDNNNNVILDLDNVAQKLGYKSYECQLLKYDEINEQLYMFMVESYTNVLFVVYQMNTGQIDEVMKSNVKYNNKPASFKYLLNKDSIYILNDENELCEYNFDTRELKNLLIKPLCYSISDNKIIYNDSEFVYEYDKESAIIKKLFRTKGHIEELNINKDGTFLLTIETLFWYTEIFDDFLRWPTHNMNCLKIYEVSTGKSKVLVNGNKKFYVTSASFLE